MTITLTTSIILTGPVVTQIESIASENINLTEEDLKYFVAKYGAVIAGIKSVGEFFEFGDDPRMKGKIFTGCKSKDCFTFLLSYLEK